MPKISELAAAASAADTDQLAANQGGTTRRVTVGQVRAGLASATHTHAISEIANLQASLDAKQPIDPDLTALAANTTNGLWARTGNGTGAARTITAGSGITVTNGDGVAGNPTIALNFTLANIPQSGATAGQVLKWNGSAWAPANDEVGSGGAAAPSIITASAASTYQATGLTGDRVIKLTLTGNVTITAPTFTGLAPNSVYFVRYELTASGGARTPSFSGYTLASGVDPARTIPDGGSLFIDTEAHTDASGAVSLQRLIGAYDVGSEPAAPLAPDDRIVFSDTSDGGRPKSAPVSDIRDLSGRAVAFTDHIPISGNGTYVILEDNTILGTITGVTYRCNTGTLTATLQIANHTSSSDLTPTGAASISGLTDLAVSTASARATATGANTMGKSGTTGRVLQVVVTNATGSPTVLTLTVRGTT